MKIYSKNQGRKNHRLLKIGHSPTTLPIADDLEECDSEELIDHYCFEIGDDEDWTTP